MLIEKMLSTLAWREPSTLLTIHRSYVDLLCELLAQRVSMVEKADRELLRRVTRAVERATNEILARVVVTPEASWHLIWQPMTRARDAVEFISLGIEREEYRINHADLCEPGWGPLGDYQVMVDGSVRTPLAIDDMMPVDVESPFAAHADLGSGTDVRRRVRIS